MDCDKNLILIVLLVGSHSFSENIPLYFTEIHDKSNTSHCDNFTRDMHTLSGGPNIDPPKMWINLSITTKSAQLSNIFIYKEIFHKNPPGI